MPTKNYKKHKENLRKQARESYHNFSEELTNKKQENAPEKYQNISGEEKEKKRQYYRKRYKNLTEDQKQRLVDSQKKLSYNI